MLEKFVKECLNQAVQGGVKSIAFPALGCGTLNMPPVRVAQKMFQVFRQFEQDHPNSSLTEIDIVIIPTDMQIFKVVHVHLTSSFSGYRHANGLTSNIFMCLIIYMLIHNNLSLPSVIIIPHKIIPSNRTAIHYMYLWTIIHVRS